MTHADDRGLDRVPPSPLRLEPRTLRALPAQATAWQLGGTSIASWLREIARWPIPASSLRLLLLPRTRRDLRPRGVLALSVDGRRWCAPSPARPWVARAGRVWIPADGEIAPAVSDEELARLYDADIVALSPDGLVVAASREDLLRPAELLAPSPREDRDWTRARPGLTLAPRLLEVRVAADTRSLEDALAAAAGGIGAASPEEIPDGLEAEAPGSELGGDSGPSDAHSGETTPGGRLSAHVADEMRRRLARAIRAWADRRPKTADDATWVDRLRAWAERVEARASAASPAPETGASPPAESSGGAVGKLLGLFGRDPDDALRFAVPLHSGQGHRGRSEGPSRLSPRVVDFDLDALGGGRPRGGWTVDERSFELLRERYHEAANREMRLGRYRRAAYIYAHLLGDLDAAASCLEQGQHWREAARIFDERLGRPAAAARCLERGGLLAEAAALWEEQGEAERAGDLRTRLGDTDAAARLYRLAADELRARDDRPSAARILETKLADPDAALDVLLGGWPTSRQSAVCLGAAFGVLGRAERHDEAGALIARLLAQGRDLPESRAASACECLVAVALDATHSDRTRDAARDGARVAAGRLLATARSSTKAERLTQAIARLEPEDRLLERDGQRWVERLRRAERPPPGPRALLGPSRELRPAGRIALPNEVEWRTAVGGPYGFVAVGIDGAARVVVARGSWRGAVTMRTTPWRRVPLLVDSPTHDGLLVVSGGSAEDFDRVEIEPTRWLRRSVVLSRPEALPLAARRVARAPEGGVHFLLVADGRITARSIDPRSEETTWAHPLPPSIAPGDDQILRHTDEEPGCGARALARWGSYFFTWFSTLVRVPPGGAPGVVRYDDEITALAAAPAGCAPRLAISLREGADLAEFGRRGIERTWRFAAELSRPLVAFSRTDRLIAAGSGEGRVYDLGRSGPTLAATIRSGAGDGRPVAVVDAGPAHAFAWLQPTGEWLVFDAPPAR